jgi:hypothetical protein
MVVCMYVCTYICKLWLCTYIYITPDTLLQVVQSLVLSYINQLTQYIALMCMVTTHPDFRGTGPKMHLKTCAPKRD